MAQQEPQWSQYMLNPQLYHPAQVSIQTAPVFSLHHRSQWLGYRPSLTSDNINQLTTQAFLATLPLPSINSGVGLRFVNDNLGPIRTMSFQLAYAYLVKLKQHHISFAFQGGSYTSMINTTQWRPPTQISDPTLPDQQSTLSQTLPDAGIGLSYKYKRFTVSVSVAHILQNKYKFNISAINSLSQRHYIASANYTIPFSSAITLMPCILLRVASSSYTSEYGAILSYNKIWGGASFRSGDAFTLLAGTGFLKENALRIGYSFDVSVINVLGKSATSHEIFLSYSLPDVGTKHKPVIRSPRFRF